MRFLRRALVGLLAVCVLPVVMAGTAQAGTISAVSLVSDYPMAGDTGVTYTWQFSTATVGTINTITMSVPAGTAGASLTVATNLGIGIGTPTLSGTTVTYAVTTPQSINASVPILLAISGFTNTSTPGTYTSTVATDVDVTAGTSGSWTVTNPNTALTIDVARVLTFSQTNPSIVLPLNPAVPAASDQSASTTLNVATNAANGYQILMSATPMTSTGGSTLATTTPNPTTGVAPAAFPTDSWGISAAAPTNGGGGTVTLSNGLTGLKYSGISSSGTAGLTQSGTTNGDSVALTLRAKVDFAQGAGTYSSVVTYTAVPSY